MTKSKAKTKHALLLSLTSLLVCVSMLVGTTFAWFTDSVTSGTNRIIAGNLDVEVYHKSASVTAENVSVAAATNLFCDKDGNQMLWEPGAATFETLTVANVGTLAFKYNMKLNIGDFNYTTLDNTNYDLRTPLKVKVLTGADKLTSVTRESIAALDWTGDYTSIESFSREGEMLYPVGNTTSGATSEEFQIVVFWDPREDDNKWNVNNGRTTSDGQPLFIDFGIYLVATQLEYENDSFDNTYDHSAIYPAYPITVTGKGTSSFSKKTTDGGNTTTIAKAVDGGAEQEITNVAAEEVSITVKNASTQSIGSASVPAAAAETILDSYTTATTSNYVSDDLELTLNVETTDTTENSITLDVTMDSLFTRIEGEDEASATVTSSVQGNVSELTQPVTVTLNLEPNLQSVTVTHTHGSAAPVAMTQVAGIGDLVDGTFHYNADSGVLTLKTSQFSEFLVAFTRPVTTTNDFVDYLTINSPKNVDILPDGYGFGVTKDNVMALINMMSGDDDAAKVAALNNMIHGAQYDLQGELDSTDESEIDHLYLNNCRQYVAADEEAHLHQAGGAYQYYKADFVVTFNKAIKAFPDNMDAISSMDDINNTVILTGEYGDWGWLKIPSTAAIEANTGYRLLKDYTNDAISINYTELCETVKQFKCGALYLNDAYNPADPLVMTIELRLYKTYSAEECLEQFGYSSTNVETGESMLVDSFTYTFN